MTCNCKSCEKEIHGEFSFCPYCGKELEKVVPIEEVKEEVKEPETKEEGKEAFVEEAKEEKKEETVVPVKESKANLKSLALAVSFVFSSLAVIFAFQINNQLSDMNHRLYKVQEHVNNIKLEQFLNQKANEYKASAPVSDEVGITNGEVLFSQVGLTETNEGIKAVFKVETTPGLKYNGVAFNELGKEDNTAFAKEVMEKAWNTHVSAEPFDSLDRVSIDLYVNNKAFATYNGEEFRVQ